METLDALRGKRDTRSYRSDAVAADVLERVLDAARMAGSAKNIQPVRIVVVTDQDDKVALKAGGDFASWIDQPPVLAVMTVRSDAGPRRLFDVGRHSQNLMVAAHAEGLASCPVTFHHPDVVAPILGLPDGVEAPMVVTLGWPGEAAGPSPIAGPRLPLADYVSYGTWS
jgi:nitroreductase